MAKVNIRIDRDANTHFDVKGAVGSSCETLTEALIRDLGDVEDRQYTEEFHQETPDYLEANDGGFDFTEE